MPVSFTVNRSTLLHTDNDNDGFADAGDVLRHTLILTNTGNADALTTVVNDTLLGSTETGLMNISPIAFDDAFTAVGNTTLLVGGASNPGTGPASVVSGNLLANDYGSTTVGMGALAGDDVTGFTIVNTGTQATSAGGSVTINADGSFSYISQAGDTGTDTFTYTIRDAGIDGIAGNADDTSSTATVTITLTGQVWYVDSGAAAGGDGTSAHPFNTITTGNLGGVGGAGDLDDGGDYIYVVGTNTGNLPLEAEQHLVGSGSALIVSGFTLATAGSNSTLGASSGTVVTLATDNDVRGITINANGAGVVGLADGGGSVTTTGNTFSASHISFTGSGQAIDIDQGGNLNVSIDSLTSSGSTGQGVQLSGSATSGTGLLSGSVTILAGAISGSTGAGFLIGDGTVGHGGTIAVSDAGTIAKTSAGNVVDVEGHTSGTVTFSGTVTAGSGGGGILVNNNSGGTVIFSAANDVLNTGTANAVTLTSNSGATISFTGGGLDIDTTSGHGFTATGGGTITVSGSSNSIATTLAGGTALDLSGVQVGVNGITFATLNTTGAANGIQIASVTQAAGSTGIDILGGAITNATTRGVDIDSTSADVTVNSTISTTAAGRSVEVTNSGSSAVGGNIINFGGAIDDNGLGINLDNNDASNGATMNFTGGLDIDAAAGQKGFNAVNGGTVNVTNGANNSIVTGTGVALTVTGTAIGASGMTFHDISANGATNGIILNGTGSNFFTVTGDGTQTAGLYNRNGSGGTIQNTSQDAISLTNASNVTIRQMNITNAGWDGVDSRGGGNITLSAVDINHPGNVNPLANGSTGNASGFGGGNGWYAQDITGVNGFDNNSRVFNWQSSQSNGVLVFNTNANFTSFTVNHALFSTSATGADGFHVNMNGTSAGTVNLTDSELTLIDQDGAQITNNGSGTVTAVIQRNNFHDADATGGDGNNTLYLSNSSNGLLNFRIGGSTAADGNTFHNLARLTTAAGVVQVDLAGGTGATPAGGSINGFIQNNNIWNDAGFVNGRRGIDIQVEADSHNLGPVKVDISNNTLNNVQGNAIHVSVVSVGGGSVTDANWTIANNSLGAAGTNNGIRVGLDNTDSSSAIEFETNVDDIANSNAVLVNKLLVSGNTGVNSANNATGATLDITNIGSSGASGSATLNATITNNTLTNLDTSGSGHVLDVLNSSASSHETLNLNITGNNTAFGNSALGQIRLRQLAGTFNVQGGVAAVSGNNNGDTVSTTGSFGTVGSVTLPTAPTNFVLVSASPFSPPPAPAAPDDPNGSNILADSGSGHSPTGDPSGGPALVPVGALGDPGPNQPAVVDDGVLSQAELNLIVNAAIDRWAAAGATAEEIAAMRAVSVTVEDLAGLALGSSDAGHIIVDSNAAGFNWFVDATPGDDGEYGGDGTRLTAAPGSTAGVRVDLLTVVMHELGHQIGLDDGYGAGDRDDLMYGTINPGERRLPTGQDVAAASGQVHLGTAFALSPVNLGTVPAGRTVTIQWDSTVSAYTNGTVPSFSNHSTVSWSGGSQDSNTETLSGVSTPALDSFVLGGTVWNDNGAGGGIANNGVKDGTEPGVDGVLVSLLVDANNDDVPDSLVPIASQLTAGGGVYSFTNLAPGNYIVRIDQDNFDAGGNTSLVNLPSSSANAPDQPDPDDNVDNDDNGSRTAGQPAFSKTITLSNNAEPTSTGANHANTNTTLDFGFVKVNTAPAFAGVDGTPTFTEGGAAVVLDNNATASDVDLTGSNYNGATLTLARSGGAQAVDVFGGSGTLSLSAGNVIVGATTIGSFTQSAGTLAITFNTNATQALVNSALQQLTYSNSSDNPSSSAVIAYVFSDGNAGAQGSGGALSANGTVTVSITAVNDAPTAAFSNHSLGPATEQQTFSLKGAGLSVADIDGNSGSETVTLAVGQGVLNVTAGTSGAGVLGSGTGSVTITGTIAQINALLNTDGTSSVDYVSTGDTPPANTLVTLTIHDGGSTGGGDLSGTDNATLSINAVNDAPVVDLNGASAGTTATLAYGENDPVTAIVPVATVTDADTTDFNSGHLLVEITNGFNAEDILSIINQGTGAGQIGYSSGVITYEGTAIADLLPFPMPPHPVLDIAFRNVPISQAAVDALIHAIGYNNSSDNPTVAPARTVTFTLNDGDGAANGGNPIGIETATINIGAVDDVPTAVTDVYGTNENVILIVPAAGVLSNDTDPDGGPKTVVSVNGVMANVGVAVTLTSGAKVTLNADGSLTYDPNHKFDTLTSTSSGETGAVNTSAQDSFTYAVNGGSSTTVNLTITGVVSPQDHLDGDGTDNVITGTPNGDYFDLSQGGNDTASGLGANDGFFFGAAFTGADTVDGGGGTNDQIGLQGNYTGLNALIMGANTIANIEAIVVLPGFNYDITMNDGNVAAGGVLKVQATSLGASNSLTFDGSAESNGSFIVYGGQGNDTMTGGGGNDGFYFGPGGFNSSDTVNGGAGNNDQLALDGNYGGFGSPFVIGGNITNVEVLVLLPGPSGSPNTFNISTSDVLVPGGQTMTIFGIQVATNITFDGSNEHDGAFRIYGGSGNDIFTGSTGNDWIFGGGSGDLLTGGAGADTYYYDAASQSTSLGFDTIFGFDDSADTIDVPFAVTGLAAPTSGNLSNASFDADLSSAFAGLTSHQAGMFTATGGDMAGRTFLVIDADGNAGYQAGSDYVIEIVTPVTPIDNPAIFV